MNKKIILLIFTLTSLLYANAQSINDVIESMPFEIVPGLADDDKDVMLVDTGLVSIPSPLGEIVKVRHSDTYLKMKTSEVGDTQIKILNKSDGDFVICVVRTVCGDVCDSNISFYNEEWSELVSNEFMEEVSVSTFLDVNGIKSSLSADIELPLFLPVSAEFVDGSDNLNLIVDLESSLHKDSFDALSPYIIKSKLALLWDGKSFVAQ